MHPGKQFGPPGKIYFFCRNFFRGVKKKILFVGDFPGGEKLYFFCGKFFREGKFHEIFVETFSGESDELLFL